MNRVRRVSNSRSIGAEWSSFAAVFSTVCLCLVATSESYESARFTTNTNTNTSRLFIRAVIKFKSQDSNATIDSLGTLLENVVKVFPTGKGETDFVIEVLIQKWNVTVGYANTTFAVSTSSRKTEVSSSVWEGIEKVHKTLESQSQNATTVQIAARDDAPLVNVLIVDRPLKQGEDEIAWMNDVGNCEPEDSPLRNIFQADLMVCIASFHQSSQYLAFLQNRRNGKNETMDNSAFDGLASGVSNALRRMTEELLLTCNVSTVTTRCHYTIDLEHCNRRIGHKYITAGNEYSSFCRIRPDREEPCEEPKCYSECRQSVEALGVWTPCNVTCGEGYQTLFLNVSKENEFLYKFCLKAIKKSPVRPCEVATCRVMWSTGWTLIGVCLTLVTVFAVVAVCMWRLMKKRLEGEDVQKLNYGEPDVEETVLCAVRLPRRKEKRRKATILSCQVLSSSPVTVEVSSDQVRKATRAKTKMIKSISTTDVPIALMNKPEEDEQ